MKPSRGCSGITRHACTQLWATSAPSSLNSSGIEQPKQSQADSAARAKQAMEKQETKIRFPTFPQPRRLRTITQYGIRILRAGSVRPEPSQTNTISPYSRGNQVTWKATAVLLCNPGLYTGALHPSY